MFRVIRCGCGLALLAVLAVMAGCNSGPEFAEVSGKVTMNGKAMDRVQVEFHPEGVGPRSIAVTDKDGMFTLKADDGKTMGAVVGPHRVVLRDISVFPEKMPSREELNNDFAAGKVIRFAGDYGDPMKTPVKKTVASGQKNSIDIELK